MAAARRPLDIAVHGAEAQAPVTARVYRRLLADVVLGELPPGRRLPLHALARRYGTSSASARQALLQLAAEGLVDTEAAQGFRASAATADDFLDLIKTLGWLASIGVRESIAHGDHHWEAGVLTAQRAFAQCMQGTGELRGDELALAGERFLEYHDALIAACRSRNLVDFCRSLNRRLLRYRNLTGIVKSDERAWAARIRNAVLERDTARAVEHLASYHRFVVDRVFRSGLLRAARDDCAGSARRA